jgi:hypothetical protein
VEYAVGYLEFEGYTKSSQDLREREGGRGRGRGRERDREMNIKGHKNKPKK